MPNLTIKLSNSLRPNALVVRRWNMYGLNKTSNDIVPNKMAIDFNMFRSFMENWIGADVNSRLAITHK